MKKQKKIPLIVVAISESPLVPPLSDCHCEARCNHDATQKQIQKKGINQMKKPKKLSKKELLFLASALKLREAMNEHSLSPSINLVQFIKSNLLSDKQLNEYASLIKHLNIFAGANLTLQQINRAFSVRFKQYLQNANLKHASQIFSKFKTVLYRAIELELIQDMPYIRKMGIKYNPPEREYLTHQELIQIFNVKTENNHYRNAFLFACFTGLRYVDICNLKHSDIKDGILKITQSKTREPLTIPLHDTALSLIPVVAISDCLVVALSECPTVVALSECPVVAISECPAVAALSECPTVVALSECPTVVAISDCHCGPAMQTSDKIFNIKSYHLWKKEIQKITNQAGIKKHITGHCARHTFATLCISNGVDIYTTSKLLGHTKVNTTQIYAKLVDEKKHDAIKKLPTL